MGNRHGSEKPKEEKKPKEKKKKKEKKCKVKGKKKMAGGSDVDVDMESSHVSHADSESMVFHSAENLSPYLDASTRSEEGAACAGFQDNGHVLSSRDFHDGFSIEACLPADLAAIGRISGVNDTTDDSALTRSIGDDVTSVASGGYSTPVLSSPQVRRGIPRSPLAQRPKDSFLEPVPPIPSDFSSNTLSSAASGHDDHTSSGERSSSRASSSTTDTNPAHCIERLEELERNIERTIIEKFSDGTSPLVRRRANRHSGDGSREGSVTPKRLSGGAAHGVVDSPSLSRKAQDAGRVYNREGSLTPIGIVRGFPSQSTENSPVVLRKAYPNPDSPSLARRTPATHGSPSTARRTPTNQSPSLSRAAPNKTESPVVLRRALNTPESPSTARRTPESPRLQRKLVGSPRTGRRRAQESPLMRRKGVPLSEDSSSTDQEPPLSSREVMRGRGRLPGFQDNQTAHKSPSRSPEVRKKPGTKTPSSSPSPRSLGRKRLTPAAASSSPVTQIKFCESNKGTPIKHCLVSTQPSTAVVLSSISMSQESVDTSDTRKDTKQSFDASAKGAVKGTGKGNAAVDSSQKPDLDKYPVSEEAIKESSESAVFGSVSPKLKRQKKVLEQSSPEERERTGSLPKDSLERGRAGSKDSALPLSRKSSDSSARSPPCSPLLQRLRSNTGSPLHSPGNVVSTRSVNVIEYKKASAQAVCISTLKHPPTPEAQRSASAVVKQVSETGEEHSFIASDITGRMTFHSQLSVESVGSTKNDAHDEGEKATIQATLNKGHSSPQQKQKFQGRESPDSCPGVSCFGVVEPVYSRIQKNNTQKVDPPVVAKKPVFHSTRSIDEGTTVFSAPRSDVDRGALTRANTVPTPAGGDESEHSRVAERRALSPGSTVHWNASRHKEGAEGQTCFQGISRHDDKNVRACVESGERAKLSPSSRSLSDCGGSNSGHITSKKNLGQRIKEVIHESTYKEVFTAELSPTCSSDDPDHIPHIDEDWDNFSSEHRHARQHHYPAYSGPSSVDSFDDSRHQSGDSPYYPRSPSVSKRTVTKACAEKRTEKKSDVSSPVVDYGRHTSQSICQENVSYLLESIAIRRIDVDANVTLPYQPHQQGQVTGTNQGHTTTATSVSSAGSAHVASSRHIAKTIQAAAGFVPGTMASSVDPDVTSHTGDACSVPESVSTQYDQSGLAKQIRLGEKSEHKETVQAETSTTREEEKPVLKGKNVSDRNKNTQGKGDKQMSVSENRKTPSLSLSLSPHTHSQISPSVPLPALSAASSVSVQTPPAVVNSERQQKTSEKLTVADSNFSDEALSSFNSTAGLQESAPMSGGILAPPFAFAKDSAKLPMDDQHSNTESKHACVASHSISDTDVSRNVKLTVTRKETHQVAKNEIAETCESWSSKPKDDDDIEKELLPEHVPPPSPTAMDMLAEEDEEDEDEDMFNAHKDSDISFLISKEMQQFGETVVKRLSSLLESQASESDSCLEDGRSGERGRGAVARKGAGAGSSLSVPKQNREDTNSTELDQENTDSPVHVSPAQSHQNHQGKVSSDKQFFESPLAVRYIEEDISDAGDQYCEGAQDSLAAPNDPRSKLTPSFPSAESFFTESDTTEAFSEAHDTYASSNRYSTTSTATDETLTSFKTRSTTDSAEFDEAHFMLPASLVFVRSVDEDDGHKVDDAVVESGGIVRRPYMPTDPTKSCLAANHQPHKPRKKRRRQPASAYDNVMKGEVNEPEPKRGSKQIRDVIDAYCDESEDSDVSSGEEGACFRDVVRESDDVSSAECESVQRRKEYVEQQVFVRKLKPPSVHSSESSDDCEARDTAAARYTRLSSSSIDSSLRIPEIEETFSELMGVKTFIDDLQDRTPTAGSVPAFLSVDDVRSKEHWPVSHRRRSRTSPAKTDRTESDLDVSEQRDDASTDSMYADDEDEGNEVVFQRSYSEEHGGEVVLSCTIYNSSHDNDADSDDFWAESSAAEESYRKLETAADEAGSAFQNARLQMHDIHQHLQDLRRQMELLQDDITSTSLTLTPDYSLESCEPRPVMTE